MDRNGTSSWWESSMWLSRFSSYLIVLGLVLMIACGISLAAIACYKAWKY